jgi:YVTN family beta-propeller protein
MKRPIFYIISMLIFTSCNDMHDKEDLIKFPDTQHDSGRMFVLCEGLFNANNSTLVCIDYDNRFVYRDFFNVNNRRGLGDTANDMKLFGNQLWIVVNISSQIEVMDINTGKSIRQIPMFDDNGRARQPRNIVFYNNQAFVCSFDGTVSRINVHTFEVEETIAVGRNPDGIAVANGKLYVSNSGGLGASFDNTVSVINIETFNEITRIEVGINPHRIQADNQGDVYLVSRGNNADIKAKFQRIDSTTDELVQSFDDLAVVNFVIRNDTAYMYNFDYQYKTYWIKVFDCISETVISEQFITDNTTFQLPFAIFAHPVTGDIFIGDAKTYDRNGTIFCFDRNGKLRYKIEDIGLNPNTFIFIDR